MTTPVGKPALVTRNDAFEELLKGHLKGQVNKCTAPAKAALGAYAGASIERSNASSKEFSAKILPNSAADIVAKSINEAEPISKKAAQTVINTCVTLTTNTLVDKAVSWSKKH